MGTEHTLGVARGAGGEHQIGQAIAVKSCNPLFQHRFGHLLSQAEHDPTSQSILFTDDAAFADKVAVAVDAQIAPGEMALLRNTSGQKTARLKLKISGDTSSLGMTYSDNP